MPEAMTHPVVDRRTPDGGTQSGTPLDILLALAPSYAAEDEAFAHALVASKDRARRTMAARQAESFERRDAVETVEIVEAVATADTVATAEPFEALETVALSDVAELSDAAEVAELPQPATPSAAAATREATHGIPTPLPEESVAAVRLPATTTHHPTLHPTRAARRRALHRNSGHKRPAVAFLALVGVLAAAQASASDGTGVVQAVTNAAARASTGADLTTGTSRSGAREAIPAATAGVDATPVLTAASEQASERAAAVTEEAQARTAAAASAAAAEAAAQAAVAAEAARRLAAPMDAPVVSGFGLRVDPFGGGSSMHEGIDYASMCGATIQAAGGGTVVESGWMGGYGWRVVVDHGVIDGHALKSTYNHMSRRDVEVGATVTKGQVLGLVGSTGASTGCHLHFEINRDGALVDPAPILPKL